jgi:hypothetical protein
MTTDLEDRLRIELSTDALRAPLTTPDWSDVTVRVPTSSRPSRLPRSLSMAAALLLVAAGVAAVMSRHDVKPATGFVPSGEEMPLKEISLDELHADQPIDMGRIAKPGSVHVVTVPGVAGWVMAYDALDYTEYSGTVRPFRCMAAPEMGMCVPTEMTIESGWTTVDRSQWANVPGGTSVVGFVDTTGDTHWQRPIGGISFFPSDQSGGTFTAYAEDGTVLATLDFATAAPMPDLYSGAVDTLTTDQREQMHDMVVDLTRECLVGAGATFPYNNFFAVMPAGADPAVWDYCLLRTTATVKHQFFEWGGRLEVPPPTTTNSSPDGTTP